jgi:heat shock protein HslJ
VHDPRGLVTPLVAAALAVLLAGCMTSADVISDRTWTLDEVNGLPAAGPGTLTLGADGRLSLEPGCNSGSGTYAIEGNRLLTGPIAVTERLCADDAVNTQEAIVVQVIDADPTFAVDTRTGQLRLMAGDATLLFDAP